METKQQWLNRQIPKYFRTVGVATSSELLYYYMANLSYTGCIFDLSIREPWFPASFPPLAIFYGTTDYLVLGKPLVDRIRSSEPNVRLVKAVGLENYEHLGEDLFLRLLRDDEEYSLIRYDEWSRYGMGSQCGQGLLFLYPRYDRRDQGWLPRYQRFSTIILLHLFARFISTFSYFPPISGLGLFVG